MQDCLCFLASLGVRLVNCMSMCLVLTSCCSTVCLWLTLCLSRHTHVPCTQDVHLCVQHDVRTLSLAHYSRSSFAAFEMFTVSYVCLQCCLTPEFVYRQNHPVKVCQLSREQSSPGHHCLLKHQLQKSCRVLQGSSKHH